MHSTKWDSTRAALKSQYHASLAMLRNGVEQCPEDLWDSTGLTNEFWQIAYHALFFTHLYLQPRLEDFIPWPGHQGDVQHEDGIAGPPYPDTNLPLIPDPYSRDEVLTYCDYCIRLVDDAVDLLDLDSSESGFHWYSVPKLEHQLVNLRHLAHHTAQLADRLRNAGAPSLKWVRDGAAAGRG